MSSVVLISTPLFGKVETSLSIEQEFGRETVVDTEGKVLISGVSLLVKETYTEVAARHPDAWGTLNPMCGPWFCINDALRESIP